MCARRICRYGMRSAQQGDGLPGQAGRSGRFIRGGPGRCVLLAWLAARHARRSTGSDARLGAVVREAPGQGATALLHVRLASARPARQTCRSVSGRAASPSISTWVNGRVGRAEVQADPVGCAQVDRDGHRDGHRDCQAGGIAGCPGSSCATGTLGGTPGGTRGAVLHRRASTWGAPPFIDPVCRGSGLVRARRFTGSLGSVARALVWGRADLGQQPLVRGLRGGRKAKQGAC